MSAAPQQLLTRPCRLWELQAAPSAASVGSVANTFTLCSGTWLMGGSTTEAASGMISKHCMSGSLHLSSTGGSTTEP